MTSLFMGTVNTTGVPADEVVVRSTATPVDVNARPAVMDDMPEPQEVETDSNPNLGMVNRQLASHWVEGSNADFTRDAEIVSAQNASNQMVNKQVSTSGTAASRELAGQTHKNLSYAVGIEPVDGLIDGHAMGNTYFVRHERPVQETAGDYMTPNADMSARAGIAAYGNEAARNAAASGMYNLWWNGGAQ